MIAHPVASRKPRICTVSQGAFGRLMRKVVMQFGHEADIRIIDQGYEDAIRSAVEVYARGDVDVFVCGGPIQEYLRTHTDVPVIEIEVTQADVFRAMIEAASVSQRIAYCGYGNADVALSSVQHLLKVEVEEFSYDSPFDARHCIAQIASKNYPVVVCPSIPSVVAGELGLKAVLLYSEQSIRDAMLKAIHRATSRLGDIARRHALQAVFDRVADGLAIVGPDGAIHCANGAFVRLAQSAALRSPAQLLGRVLHGRLPSPSEAESVTIRSPDGETRTFEVLGVPYPCDGSNAQELLFLLREMNANAGIGISRSPVGNESGVEAPAEPLDPILGSSQAISDARRLAEQYACSEATVLITGESGCGKEVFAQAIHKLRCGAAEPFIGINCSALPGELLESELFGFEEGAFSGSRRGGKPGLLELAGTGTVFLDEIGEMPGPLQAKLLRVLQQREFMRLGGRIPVRLEARVIAASNRDLESAVASRQFRDDLYYRLNVLRIRLPALRERQEDVAVILRSLLQPLRQEEGDALDGLVDALANWFRAYPWPGNVRELVNFAARLMTWVEFRKGVLPSVEDFQLLFPEVSSTPPADVGGLAAVRRDADISYVRQVLTRCGGDLGKAAQELGISRTTLWRRLRAQPGMR